MKAIVIYSTRSGNTEKVAREIAAELTCPCVRITGSSNSSSIDLSGDDIVFVGTGIYRGQPHQDLMEYLEGIHLVGSRRFALFMTCFGWGKGIADKNVIDSITAAVRSKGQRMLGNCFSCFGGGLGFVKRGHPDAEELSAARKWAGKIAR